MPPPSKSEAAAPFSLCDRLEQAVPESDFEVPDYSFGRSNGHIQVREHITYIVCGLIFRGDINHTEVLLVQEAKESCRGKWYLPAGRLERGEHIHVATEREVLEEAGLQVEINQLVYAEVQGNGWYRLSFLCDVVGGILKTTAQADAESLQADWFKVQQLLAKPCPVPLRGKDVVRIIEHSAQIYRHQKVTESPPVHVGLVNSAVPGMFVRLVIVRPDDALNTQFHVLLSNDLVAGTSDLTIPIVEFSLIANTVAGVLSKYLRDLMDVGAGALRLPPTVCLSVQCRPAGVQRAGHDGLCLTLLVLVRREVTSKLVRPDHHIWKQITDHRDNQMLAHALKRGPVFRII